MGLIKNRDIQSVARLSNVFKEQFYLFFSEKMVTLMVEKTGENRCARCDFFTKSDKYGQIRTGTIFLFLSLHRQN